MLAGFRSKAGRSFRARLLLDAEGQVTFDMPARPGADASPEAEAGAAPRRRRRPLGARRRAEAKGTPAAEARPRAGGARCRRCSEPGPPAAGDGVPVPVRRRLPLAERPQPGGAGRRPAPAPAPPPPGADLNPAEYLRQAGLEVVDKRPEGRLWVVDGDPPSAPLAALRERGVRFAFARNGGRATGRRPAWYTL